MSPCVIAVFAKAAIPGAAKTRLIPALGPHGAARLHVELVRQSLQIALAANIGEVELWCTEPDPALSELARTLGIKTKRQCEGGLGLRMAQAFTALLADAASVVLVGTDCPVRGVEDFREARSYLVSGCDAVLGPTEDGGYHLIALSSPQPGLFANVAWSTPQVMQQTRERLREWHLSWHELPLRWDVDRPADLHRLRRDEQFEHLFSERS